MCKMNSAHKPSQLIHSPPCCLCLPLPQCVCPKLTKAAENNIKKSEVIYPSCAVRVPAFPARPVSERRRTRARNSTVPMEFVIYNACLQTTMLFLQRFRFP